MTTKELVGKNIRDRRNQLHYSQELVANELNMSNSYLSMIENGQKNPTLDMLESIAIFLEMKIQDLFRPEDQSGTHREARTFSWAIRPANRWAGYSEKYAVTWKPAMMPAGYGTDEVTIWEELAEVRGEQYRYTINRRAVVGDDGKDQAWYGLQLDVLAAGDVWECWAKGKELFASPIEARRLLYLMINYQMHKLHFMEVVEDYLCASMEGPDWPEKEREEP